jgi:hypothetical protein
MTWSTNWDAAAGSAWSNAVVRGPYDRVWTPYAPAKSGS